MPTLDFALPVVESGRVYAPGSLALEIVNLQRTAQDTLRSVRGPCPLIQDYGSGFPATYGHMHGIFHAKLDQGQRDVTLIRTGTRLIEHVGWRSTSTRVRTLVSNLSSDPNAKFPDQFVLIGDRIIWTNGIDPARIYDGYKVLELGFTDTPSAPTPLGPAARNHPVFTNGGGYNHPGAIGVVGDVYDSGDGALLPDAWFYAVQNRDAFGNLSPLSPVGGPVTLRPERTAGFFWHNGYEDYPDLGVLGVNAEVLGYNAIRLDDLTKQFFVEGIPLGPTGTVARDLYRKRGNGPFQRLMSIEDNVTTSVPDNTGEGGLGSEPQDVMPMPRFSVCCSHQGRLWFAVGPRVYYSEVGFPGTVLRTSYVEPDSAGGEITGLASWNGHLFAFTGSSTYAVQMDAEGIRTRAVSSSDGCAAPNSIRATAFGELVWLASNGFRAMGADMVPRPISKDIDTLFSRFNPAFLSRATAVWKSTTQEYLCAVSEAGVPGNNLILAYDGTGFRRLNYGIRWGGLCETQDWTRRLLGCGKGAEDNVFVLDAEHRDYTPPTKTGIFRSTWIKPDVLGRKRFSSARIYIGIVEEGRNTFNVSVYRNGRNDAPVGAVKTREACAPDLPATLGTAMLGTDVVRSGRQTWKVVDVPLPSVESFQILITATEPSYIHLHALAFEFTYEDAGDSVSRQ